MDQAEITMQQNLLKNTGKSIEEWAAIALASGFEKPTRSGKYRSAVGGIFSTFWPTCRNKHARRRLP